MRGDGRIWQPKGTRFLWVSYYLNGENFRESTKTTDRQQAEKYLRRRLKEVGSAQLGHSTFVGPVGERITVNVVLDNLVADKVRRGCKDVSADLKPVRAKFGTLAANRVTAAGVARWVDELRDQDYAPATCNRWTQLLDQAYTLAIHRRELATKPYIAKLSEAGNARQGTFTATEFERLVMLLPEYLQDFVRWAYVTGWRAGSIRSLRWADLQGSSIVVRAQYSKIREAQSIPLVGPLRTIVERRRAHRLGEYVFHYPDGEPIGSYKFVWKRACQQAGCAGKMFHDLRRTAATNLRRSGVPENVAMQITGHQTRAMFDRYSIREEKDVRAAIVQREAWEQLERAKEMEQAAPAGPVQ